MQAPGFLGKQLIKSTERANLTVVLWKKMGNAREGCPQVLRHPNPVPDSNRSVGVAVRVADGIHDALLVMAFVEEY